jgi:hypothetical protein
MKNVISQYPAMFQCLGTTYANMAYTAYTRNPHPRRAPYVRR